MAMVLAAISCLELSEHGANVAPARKAQLTLSTERGGRTLAVVIMAKVT
jgi:hypothetical protein